MSGRTRVTAFAALLGFLGCTLGVACVLATMCPSHSCEPCPVVLCRSVAVNTSPKVDVVLALLPAGTGLLQLPAAAAPRALVTQIPAFLSHEFRRPMRN